MASRTTHSIQDQPLVGRSTELARLEREVHSARVVHLTGPPGVGKSRLAAALAERSERELLWVTLRGARTLAALRTALGVEAPGEQELQVGLRSLRDCLLVLDDADLALPALERAMGRWLAACPGLQVLLTSQRTGDFPEAHSESLAPLERGAAVELFCARWVEVTGRRPSPEERQLSESLCERLDHLPLALEVAASRGRVLSMKQLHQRLHSHADELLRERGSARSALGVSLDLTWAGLDEPLRHLLMRCAVWPGAFSLQDLDALAPELDQVHLLSEVLVRSLLCKIHGASDEPRFRLYRPVRDYAWLELQTQDPSQLLERRDAYVLAESERAVALLRGPRAVAAEHRLVELSPALEERRRRALDEADVDTALRCTLALHEVMLLRGLRDLEPYREVGSAALNGGCESTRHARFLLAWAVAGARIGQVEEPLRQLDQAVESLASSPHAAEALLARGRFHAQHGAFDQARRDLAEAALRVRETGDTYLLGSIRNVEGCVHEIRGDLDAALQSFETARSLFRACGSARMEAAVVGNQGVVRHAQHRLEDARVLTEQALELARESENRAIEADSLLNLASWHLTAGNVEQGAAYAEQALEQQRRVGNRRFEGLAMVNLALAQHELRELSLARDTYQRAIQILRECGEVRFERLALPFFAAVEAELGLLSEARQDLERARLLPPGADHASMHVVDVVSCLVAVAEARAATGSNADELLSAALVDARLQLEAARTRMQAAPDSSRGPELAVALRLAQRALHSQFHAAMNEPSSADAPELLIGPGGRWFARLGEPVRVDLSRRAALRRILLALVERHAGGSGGASALELFEVGWPGERVRPESAVGRIYTAIKTLRQLGLEGLLLREERGYLLGPEVRVERQA